MGFLSTRVDRLDAAEGRFDMTVGVFIHNPGAGAVTLRGVECPGARRCAVVESVRLFGARLDKRPPFVRIDAGETQFLQPPDRRVVVEGGDARALVLGGQLLLLDFGPLGVLEVLARLPESDLNALDD